MFKYIRDDRTDDLLNLDSYKVDQMPSPVSLVYMTAVICARSVSFQKPCKLEEVFKTHLTEIGFDKERDILGTYELRETPTHFHLRFGITKPEEFSFTPREQIGRGHA